MARTKRTVRTDDGDELPPNPSADVAAAIHLLEYARSRGFRVGPILEVGTVKMHIADLRQSKVENLGAGSTYDDLPHPDDGIEEPSPGTAG